MKNFITAFFMAWGNFTIIPCPFKKWDMKARKLMLALMQLVGIIIGLIVIAIFFLLVSFFEGSWSLNFILGSIIATLPILMTGFIHLDGFMDCCDAILSRRDLETRRKILKDSTVGAFSVVSVAMLFTLLVSTGFSITFSKLSTIKVLMIPFLMAVVRGLSSRDVLMLGAMGTSQYKDLNESFDSAKDSLEIEEKRIFTRSRSIYSMICSSILLLEFIGFLTLCYYLDLPNIKKIYLIFSLIFAVFAQVISRRIAVKNLQGMNGDIAGYSIVIGELVGFLTLALV